MKNKSAIKKTEKTVKEFSLEEEAKKMQAKLNEAAQKEQKEVTDFVVDYLSKKGYGISARMILNHGQAPVVEPFIAKIQK